MVGHGVVFPISIASCGHGFSGPILAIWRPCAFGFYRPVALAANGVGSLASWPGVLPVAWHGPFIYVAAIS